MYVHCIRCGLKQRSLFLFHSLNSVTELLLFDNMLESIPPTLFNMKSLEMLNLDRNHLMQLPATVSGWMNDLLTYIVDQCSMEVFLL